MKVYIAGRYYKRDVFRHVRDIVELAGIDVTSRWLDETHALDSKPQDLPDQMNRDIAWIDLDDVLAADAVLFFAEDPYNQPPRGGRHVEFGYALASGKRIFVIGGRENIFHYLESVTHYATVEEFLADGRNFN